MLNCDRRNDKSFQRLLLNSGRWLGMITIAQDKSVWTYFGDLNELVVEAYYKENGELQIIVPFVSCKSSNRVHIVKYVKINTVFQLDLYLIVND